MSPLLILHNDLHDVMDVFNGREHLCCNASLTQVCYN